jgi:hypothetical protein
MKSKKQLAITVGSLVMASILLATLLPLVVFAEGPQRINYQGYLTDSGSNPVDGSVSIVFSIYSTDIGGTSLWSETQTVMVKKGLFNVQLGSATPLPSFSVSPRYLGIKVGTDPEMTPRQLLASAPYALNADTLEGQHSSAFVLKSGDTMIGSVDNAAVLEVSNTGREYGTGVAGWAQDSGAATQNWGGIFEADGGSGTGVFGYAWNYGAAAQNYGGHFEAAGGSGTGVFGYASNNEAAAQNYGGYFEADGGNGIGVYGKATGFNAYAGYFSGNVHVTGDITKEYTIGTSNLATPIAYACVYPDGTIFSGTPNVVSALWNAVYKWYEITITGEYYSIYHISIVTASPPTGVAAFACVGSVSGNLLVTIYDITGKPMQCQFQFVTYKP